MNRGPRQHLTGVQEDASGRARLLCRAWAPLLGLALAPAAVHAQPDLLWITQFGTGAEEYALALASDEVGGGFVAGRTSGSLGGPNAGLTDAYLTRLGADGKVSWTVQFGTGSSEDAYGASPDGSSGVFVVGSTGGSLAGVNAGGSDSFLARFDSSGNLLWIQQWGTSSDDYAVASAPDGSGGVFVAGYSYGPGFSTDVYLARYDADGDVLWLNWLGTDESDWAEALASDGLGGVFITGYTGGDLGGPNAGDWDPFLARYDGFGKQMWAVQFGTPDDDRAFALATDGAGGVFVGGAYAGYSNDAFVARFSGDGQPLWLEQFGSDDPDWVASLTPDGSGGVVGAGTTYGDLGGSNAGSGDAFLTRFDPTGKQVWITQVGTGSGDVANAVISDGVGGVMMAGDTDGDLGGPNAGSYDAFLARFGGSPCYADADGDGTLDIFDFLAFVNAFNGEDFKADCDGNGGLDLFDFLCFVNAFNDGC